MHILNLILNIEKKSKKFTSKKISKISLNSGIEKTIEDFKSTI